MAFSHMDQQQEQLLSQGYTHKKFNCSYSHKKLGMRLRQRDDNNNIKENTEHQQVAKKQPLFRPYALGNDTPRKRKISRSTSDSSEDENSQPEFTVMPQTSAVTNKGYAYLPTYPSQEQSAAPVIVNTSQTCSSPALSPNSYAERLQRQRAALYMRYMQQFHSGSMAAASQGAAAYQPMGYPNVTAPIYNGC